MTFAKAREAHLNTLAALGWKIAPHLKVPHATRADGLRLWFKPQAVYFSRGTVLGDARSVHEDSRAVTTLTLISEAERLSAG